MTAIHHGESYALMTGGAMTALFGAITADSVTTWGGVLVTVAVSIYTAYRIQHSQAQQDRRNATALDAIYRANEDAIAAKQPVPFPEYMPPASSPK
jgi:hypothetical protein